VGRIHVTPVLVQVVDRPFRHRWPLVSRIAVGAGIRPVRRDDPSLTALLQDAAQFVPEHDALIVGQVLDEVTGMYFVNLTIRPLPPRLTGVHDDIDALKGDGVDAQKAFCLALAAPDVEFDRLFLFGAHMFPYHIVSG